MPAIIKRLTPDGLVEVAYQADNLRDAAKYEPRQGVYTVSNTYNITQTLLFAAHLDRLEDSARREGIPLRYDRARLRFALRQMIQQSGYGDVRFRISVPSATPQDLILSIEPFTPPARSILRAGVSCLTSSEATRRNPAAKSNDWMRQRETVQTAMPAGVYETIIVDARGRLLEGLSSNFYAIIDGKLRTAGSGVLAGISRTIVFEVCQRIVPLSLNAPALDEMARFQEAFLTSSSRGIIPVVEIDGAAIDDGRVGSNTLALREAYQSWVADHLEEL